MDYRYVILLSFGIIFKAYGGGAYGQGGGTYGSKIPYNFGAGGGYTMQEGIQTLANLELSSPSFARYGTIPIEYTCDGKNIAPLLKWVRLTKPVVEFALTCIDPDAPGGPFVHWVVYNIPGKTTELSMQLGRIRVAADGTKQGLNSFNRIGYDGPCPPKGDKPHQYVFTLYGLNKEIILEPGATHEELLTAIKNQSTIDQQTQLVGVYGRPK